LGRYSGVVKRRNPKDGTRAGDKEEIPKGLERQVSGLKAVRKDQDREENPKVVPNPAEATRRERLGRQEMTAASKRSGFGSGKLQKDRNGKKSLSAGKTTGRGNKWGPTGGGDGKVWTTPGGGEKLQRKGSKTFLGGGDRQGPKRDAKRWKPGRFRGGRADGLRIL